MSNSITMYGFYRAPTPHITQHQQVGPTINRSKNTTRSTVAAAMPRKKGAVEKNTAQEDSQSPVRWEKSYGKKFLRKELWNLDSAFQSMSIRDIHSSDPRFSVYPLKNFTTSFKNLKKKVDGLRVQVDFDEQAVSQTRSLILDHLTRNEDIHTGMGIQQKSILKTMYTIKLQIQCCQAN